MDLLTSKLLSMFGIGCLALFFGLLPLKVKKLILSGDENSRKRRRRENIISALLCFGAGVLIATVFIHMLPETRAGFAKADSQGLLWGHEESHPELSFFRKNNSINPIENNLNGSDESNHHHIGHNHNSHAHDYHDHHDDHDHDKNHNHDLNHSEHDHHDHVNGHAHGHNHLLAAKNSNILLNNQDLHSHHPHEEHDHDESSKNVLDLIPLKEEKNDLKLSVPEKEYFVIDPNDRDVLSTLPSLTVPDSTNPNENHILVKVIEAILTPEEESLILDATEVTDSPLSPTITETESTHENTIDSLQVVDPTDLLKTVELIKAQSKRNLHTDDHIYDPHFDALINGSDSHDNHNHDDHDHDEHGSHGHDHSYPLAELFTCIGFFMIYFIEEVFHKVFFRHSSDSHEQSSSGSQSGHSHSHVHSHVPKPKTDIGNTNKVAPHNGTNGANPIEMNHSISKDMSGGIDNLVFAGDLDATGWNTSLKNTVLNNSKILPITDALPLSSKQRYEISNTNETISDTSSNSTDTSGFQKPTYSNGIIATIQNVLLLLAIGFHAIFEGMAIGLQEEQNDVWYLTFAISAHKFVIMFCVGLELLKDDTSKIQMVMSTVVLALITPFGTAIGIIVTENSKFGGSEHILVVSILQGLAGGTLLYVAFLEILERERSKSGGRFLKFLSLLIGFSFMCSLEAIGGHSH